MRPQVGDRYVWHGIAMQVIRMTRKSAILHCTTGPGSLPWTKRQPLPLPATFVAVADDH